MAIPFAVVTETLPLDPTPTVAVMFVGEFTKKEDAEVPPNVTLVVLSKFTPVILTVVPATPKVGVNEVMIGPLKVNPGDVAVPKEDVTLKSPLAPGPTIAVMPVVESTVNEEASTPPNFTFETPLKLDPKMVTLVPLIPEVGENELITGAILEPIIFLSIEIFVDDEFAEIISGFESPSRSPTAT